MKKLIASLSDSLPNIPHLGMPVTIITGFLGSGKTTLLNQILNNRDELKIAVLVNEFGAINIDSQLLVAIEEDMIELGNGCICCTINDNLVEAVYRILEREDKIEYLIIETTGLADPLPIILTFLGTELRYLTRIDSIITVVDSETFTDEHFESDVALSQISYADIIILNKIDRVSPQKIAELEIFIRGHKLGARILKSQYGQVPLTLLLDVGLTQAKNYQTELKQFQRQHQAYNHHLETDGFISISFQKNKPFEAKKFEEFLTQKMPLGVFRAKGILWFKDSELRHIFQLSGPRYDIQADEWKTVPQNQLVFIGRDLEPDFIVEQLEKCLVNVDFMATGNE